MEQIAQKAVEDAVLKVATALEDQVDDQLHRLENMGEDELEQIRQSRMQELRKREEKKKEWLMKGHGEYGEVLSEKEFFATMKGEERMVCHFYRDNWPCKVMDKHMGLLAQKHIETKFVKIHAEKSPFLTEKLKIWMLPTLALIKSEKTVDYVVGFDELGGVDDFRTEVLAARLAGQGLIFHEAERYQQDASGSQQRTVKKGFAITRTESDEDSDFD